MKRIVLLGTEGDPNKDIVYNAINSVHPIQHVILEQPVSRKLMVKRRIKKLGYFKVAGQLAFQLLAVRLLSATSNKRVAEIRNLYHLDTTPIPIEKVRKVNSINDAKVAKLLTDLKPDLVLVKGTRIISKDILSSVTAPFVNMHVGITPLYRGVHGGYWSLATNDAANAGTTIHFVDKGIDTGRIIAQKTIKVDKSDNFVTYPLLQIAAGIELLKENLPALLEGQTISSNPPQGISKLWYHPTLWFYLKKRLLKGIK